MNKNILLDKLPQFTRQNLRIRTDFRESIKFELLMQDSKITEKEKIMLALKLYYYDISKIKDIKLAIDEILWFYRCGKEIQEQKESKQEEVRMKQIYSYEFDDNKIYSAFIQQYNIDLQKQDLHWWQFKTMFECLTNSTQIVQIMEYRAMDLSKIKDKNMKKQYKELKAIYALPDMRTEEEKENDFAEAFL